MQTRNYIQYFILAISMCCNIRMHAQEAEIYSIDTFRYVLPSLARSGDLDSDGDLDLVGQYDNTHLVWYRNQNDTIQIHSMYISIPADIDYLLVQDMDGDTDMDILVGSEGAEYIGWLSNEYGDGSVFDFHYIYDETYTFGPNDLVTGDIDGDGDLDIVTNLNYAYIVWYENSGEVMPMFTEHIIIAVADTPDKTKCADFDGDGDQDIMHISFYDGDVVLYKNDGMGIFTTPGLNIGTIHSVNNMVPKDIDGDSDIDMVFACGKYGAGDESLSVWYNDGTASYTDQIELFNLDDVTGVTTADFNGDGYKDILCMLDDWWGDDPDNVLVFLGQPDATFSEPIEPFAFLPDQYMPSIRFIVITDINHDGLDDLLGGSTYSLFSLNGSGLTDTTFTGFTEYLKMRNNFFELLPMHANTSDEQEICAVDKEGRMYLYHLDTIADQMKFNSRLDSIGVLGLGGGTITDVFSFDLENDGDQDLFTSFYSGGSGVFILEHQADDTFTKFDPLIPDKLCYKPIAADLNSDGFTDIVAADYYSEVIGYDWEGFEIYEDRYRFYWLENIGGTGLFTFHNFPGDYLANEGVAVVTDYDADGDTDVFTYNAAANYLYCYTNLDGAGLLSTKTEFWYKDLIYFYTFLDEDNDGDQDMLYNSSADSLFIRQNDGTGAFSAPILRAIGAKVRAPEGFICTDVNNDGTTDVLCGTTDTRIFLNMPGIGIYPAPWILDFNYYNFNIGDIDLDQIPEIIGQYMDSYAYNREITLPEEIMLFPSSAVIKTLDEDGTMVDTFKVRMQQIPQETTYFKLIQTTLPGSDLELQFNDATSDTIILSFFADSTSLDWQYIFIQAFDDTEVDEAEKGIINFQTYSETGLYAFEVSANVTYKIIDNDAVSPDPANISVFCSDMIITEGISGTACFFQLLEHTDFDVFITVQSDDQLDFGNGPADTIQIKATSDLIEYQAIVDAVDDGITEGIHSGSFTVTYTSEADNYDSGPEISVTIEILEQAIPPIDSVIVFPEFNASFLPETHELLIQYNFQTKQAVIIIYNIHGQEMLRLPQSSATGSVMINTTNWSRGYYLITATDLAGEMVLGQAAIVY